MKTELNLYFENRKMLISLFRCHISPKLQQALFIFTELFIQMYCLPSLSK